MFIVENNGNTFGVKFQYRDVELQTDTKGHHQFVEIEQDQPLTTDCSIRTVCKIEVLPKEKPPEDCKLTENLIGYGETTCALSDNFNKHKGRVLALKKALATSANPDCGRLPKATRKLFWDAYFANHRDRRTK